ncbi:Ribonuclease H, partial [Parasponia andersonii]
QFVSRSTDKYQPFFEVLKGSKRFEWTKKCEQAFQELKKHLGFPPLLSKPNPGEELCLYLAVSKYATSAALIRKEGNIQRPVYYISKRLLNAETRYPEMEKLALALVIASRKLRSYFHAHSIRVFTNFPLKQVLQRPETSPRTAIKGQALADFIAEFTYDVDLPTRVLKKPASGTSKLWKLYVDGSSNENGAGAGLVLISPEGHNIHCALCFKFPVSNNEVEYEALIAGLKLAQEMKVEIIEVYSDSQLVVCQVKGDYQVRGERMMAYL